MLSSWSLTPQSETHLSLSPHYWTLVGPHHCVAVLTPCPGTRPTSSGNPYEYCLLWWLLINHMLFDHLSKTVQARVWLSQPLDLTALSGQNQLLAVMATAATVEESQHSSSLQDPWNDSHLLDYLQKGELSVGLSAAEKDQVAKRTRSYSWRQPGKLFRRYPDGSVKEVPEPACRAALVKQVHETGGHFGHRRTTHQILLSFWWPRVYQDVKAVCRDCEACDRSHANFNTMQPVLQPLPIQGLFYRWGMDLAGPFPVSKRGNTYILVAVEHFSKWIEVFPLQNKSAAEVTYYANQLFSRYLAPAEVVTNGGGEFEGEFQSLLQRFLIDHRVTSPNHPQANGLAERGVGTVKTSIKRYSHSIALDKESPQGRAVGAVTESISQRAKSSAHGLDWDSYIPFITMGYNITPHASSKFSPYQVIFAVPPIILSGSREKFDVPIDFNDVKAAARSISTRAAILRSTAPIAGQNLHISQHRDRLRYARLRSAGYLPQVANYQPGQYVYLSRIRMGQKPPGLSMAPLDTILRVLEVRANGTLLLVGSCGSTIVENAVNCSPCHLQIKLQQPLLPAVFRPRPDHPCEICHLPDRPRSM